MSAQLSTYKRLLSRFCNKLETIVARYKEENLEVLPTEESTILLREYRQRLEEAVRAIETYNTKVQQLIRDYATAVDNSEQVSEKETEDFNEYTSKAEEVLCSSLDYMILLEARLSSFNSCNKTSLDSTKDTSSTAVEEIVNGSKRLELPTLPIPTFNGDLWDWDNFWTLFDTNVNSQPMPDLYKFNYLLNSLKGEPHQAVKKFRVSSDNYGKAIDFLKNKYGDKEELVSRLYDRLEKLQPSTTAVKEQRSLLEHIQVIIAQLKDKEEHVNNQWVIKQVLSKFPNKLQRKVLENKYAHNGRTFDMENLLKLLEEFITTEEKVQAFTRERSTTYDSSPLKKKMETIKRICMYCKEEHKSMECTKYSTPQVRSQYLRENKLCFICASPRHTTAECKKRSCFNCQGAHHTSCCFKSAQVGRNLKVSTRQQKEIAQKEKKSFHSRQHKSNPLASSNVHQVTNHVEEEEEEEVAICELQTKEAYAANDTYLPTGVIQVLDPKTKNLRKIAVLLDTGAELSFIDKKLAEELQLRTLESTRLRLRTFGSEQVKESMCRKVKLEAWNMEGEQIMLDLFTYDVISKSFEIPSLIDEDVAHLREKHIPLEMLDKKKRMRPEILLGCDKLWSFIKEDRPHINLPSGLHLIESRLGYLISGQVKSSSKTASMNEADKWDGYWTLETQVNTISIIDDGDHEQEKWEKFWSLEAAGTERFCCSEDTERTRADKAVLKHFRETIEKREDGYYVHLPWKEGIIELPDNKAIAQRRLVSLWNTLRKDPSLLRRYDEVFQDQLDRNILEQVPQNKEEHKHVHFLPHQAVITPHKTTTKLRVVYDASAHYRNCLSLNDALHRGPVILPQLFGILLRFRFGRIAMISDVEKAFLQVRLHEEDRDATRCLWLRDYTAPPVQDNIIMLRFTRVPFGLNASPFLLAATTHYHLDQYKESYKMIDEIKDNLYVDNLIVTLNTVEEASTCYEKMKQMFKELSMNLREFVSNEEQVMNIIAISDKSSELTPKVLGVRWNSLTDQLEVSCNMITPKVLTKRTVTSAVASIYDPMGWMLPLIHKSKVFLQSLWKDKFDWDTILDRDRAHKWQQICDSMQGFNKEIPRFVTKKHAKVHLAVFADASAEAIATCVYLKTKTTASLLLAKGKLPSIKYEATIPKKELNAVTLAMRVINSVVTQLQVIIAIEKVYLFSDSEIVYNWIKKRPLKDAGVMVLNRLREIAEIDDHLTSKGLRIYYGYVPTEQNPADCGTRGLNKGQLKDHFWWTGPSFLRDSPENWLTSYKLFQMTKETDSISLPPELALVNQAVSEPVDPQHSDILEDLKDYPFSTIKRITARMLRFTKIVINRVNQRRESNIRLSPLLEKFNEHHDVSLGGEEIAIAGKIVIQVHQRTFCTAAVLKSLAQLNIKLDKEGLMRCHGRMGKSCLHDIAKFPYIVLQNSWLSETIIRECHGRGHPGIGHTIALVRQKFWIPKLRAQVTRLIRRCVECQRFNNRPYKYPNQSDLPQARVQQTSPFQHVGLDYFGPLTVKTSEDSTSKCYGAIITCMVTRLIYLDVVTDLSTIAFLNMLRRFFGRRGVPRSITSDNAPTFLLGEEILADSRIKNLEHEVAITRDISDREIVWKHITPFAPWQGGFYERLIRSVKQALYKTLKGSTYTFEEMLTTLVEIEALLNTRPLVYMSSESCNETIIRPIDFVQNKIILDYPVEATMSNSNDSPYLSSEEQTVLSTKLQTIQALESSCKSTDKFWKIWKTEYLTALREKHKLEVGHNKSRALPRVDDCVLITDAVQSRHSWRMGRITKLVKGEDGEVREAVVILPSRKQIRRPVNLLVPLELEDRTINTTSENDSSEDQCKRYNMRPRKTINYTGESKNVSHFHLISSVTLAIAILSLCGLSQQTRLPDWTFPASSYFIENQISILTIFKNDRNYFNKIDFITTSRRCITFKTFDFRMAFANLHKEIQCLTIIMKDNTRTSIEEHLKLTEEAMGRQVEASLAIRNDYNHLKEHLNLEEDPIDQKAIASRLHLSASVIKERYLMLCNRYAFLYKYYDLHFPPSTSTDSTRVYPREFNDVMVLDMDYHMKQMESLIKKLDKRQEEADKNARLERSRSSDKEKRIIRSLDHKLKKQDEELFVLKAKIASTSMERSVKRGEAGCQVNPTMVENGMQTEGNSDKSEENSEPPNLFDDSEMEVNELAVVDEAGSDSEEPPLDDNKYFRKLVQESSGRDEPEDKPNEEVERREEECRKLAEEISEMERILQVFPYRRYGEAVRGTHVQVQCAFCRACDQHYSDSCPRIKHSSARYELIRREELCLLCLENCPEDQCRFDPRPCFYCEKIRGTIVDDLIPRGNHHKALCTVPDGRDAVKRWLSQLRERYAYVRWELVQIRGPHH